MSRSYRAWMEMESCEPVSAGIGAGERVRVEEQAPLGPGSVLGAAFSTTRLVKFLATSMLVIAAAPASALAGSVSARHAKPPATQIKQQSTPIRPAGVVVLAPGSGDLGHGPAAVRALQSRLARAGDTPGPIDALYGPRTEQAVARFQAAHGLHVDGIAGPQTLAYLGGQRPVRSQATPRSHPTGSPHRANLRSGRGRSLPQAVFRQPRRAAAARKLVPGSHSTGSPPVGLLVLLIALAVAVGLSATWLAHRRRNKRYTIADAAANGAASSDLADAIAAPPSQTTTSDHTRAPRPAATPNGESGALDDADRAFRHALLLEEQGDQTGAMAAFRRADQLGHGAAASNLGVLLERQGDETGAEDSYRRAEQRGDANGAFNLAALLEERGDQMGAMAAYQRAEQLGNPTIADMARGAVIDLTRQNKSPIAVREGGGHNGR